MNQINSQLSQLGINYEPQNKYKDTNDFLQQQQQQQQFNYTSSDEDNNNIPIKIIQKRVIKKQYNLNNQQSIQVKGKQYHQNAYTKYDSRISLQYISNQIQKCQLKEMTKQKKNKDKVQRATVEQVLDERTRRILLKLITKQIVTEINGCISTGKQANVYYAVNSKSQKQYAIKIYKTSILIFKDRDRYVQGQFRFRRGYCSSNPRKMVTMWAEKQLRNLKRIQGTIKAPIGLLVKSNVLVMDFIGKDMVAAPRLKDAVFASQQEISNIYLIIIRDMRKLYQQCKLIHADLSEYNLLYYEGQIYMIDVSQSVQHDHPAAIDFLRRDISNINIFFKKKSVNVFNQWNIFAFIVGFGIKEGDQIRMLESMAEQYDHNDGDNNNLMRQSIFRNITIPKNLSNIPLHKVEKQLFAQNPTDEQQYQRIVSGLNTIETASKILQVQEQQDSSMESRSENEEKGSQEMDKQKKVGGKQKYQGLSKLQRKHKVKQQKRQKRKIKIPKKQKKKLNKK